MGAKRTIRPRGTGSFRRLSSGNWQGRILLPGTDITYSYTAKSKAEVHRKLQDAVAQVERGQTPPNEHLTVGAWLDQWLADVVAPTREPRTYEGYDQCVRLYLKPILGKKKLIKLTPADVQAMMADLMRRGLSPCTVRHARAALRRAINVAMRQELVTRNVAKLTDPPPIQPFEAPSISADDARRILAAVEGTRVHTPCLLALTLGMRQGEVLGLRWEAVDLDNAELRVETSLHRARERGANGKRLFTLRRPKTPKSRRTIPLPEPLVAALRSHLVRQKEDRLRAGPKWKGEEWNLVCCSVRGAPVDGSNLTHDFQAALFHAGLPRIRFHDLRHGAASLLVSMGVSVPVAMAILGHAHASTLLNVYARAHKDEKRQAIAAMGKLLGGQQ